MPNPWRAGETTTAAALNLARVHARYYQSGTPQSIPHATDRRLKFNSASTTNGLVSVSTHADGGQVFTLGRGGLWTVIAGCRYEAGSGANFYISFADSDNLSDRYGGIEIPGGTVLNIATEHTFSPGFKMCVISFHNHGSPRSFDLMFANETFISLTWKGDV